MSNAQEVALCKKKAEMQTFLKLIATLWKKGRFLDFSPGALNYREHVVPGEHVYVSKESSSPIPSKYIDVVMQPKADLGNLEENVSGVT